MCFKQSSWDYLTKSDFEQQKEDLSRLFRSIEEMGFDRSLFLCEFPMLTRLQVGLIYCLAGVFEKVILYGDPAKGVVGIMLHKFLVQSQPDLKNMLASIAKVIKVLNHEEFDFPILQFVPMKTLVGKCRGV